MAKDLNKDSVYRAAKPQDKDHMINDGDGLWMIIKPSGTKLWQFVFTFNKCRGKVSIGIYPNVSLSLAREKAAISRDNVTNGIDPRVVKNETKEARRIAKINDDRAHDGLPLLNSFADTALKWLESIEHLTKEKTSYKKISRLKTYAFPIFGNTAIDKVKAGDVLAALKPLIQKSYLETVHRLRSEVSCIFSYAIVHGLTDFDPAQPVAKQIPAQKVKHRAALIDSKQVGQLLRDISNYQGTFVVQCAFRISPLLFQRPGEIRQMLWSDVDLNAKEWRPYISKTDFHHIVPLSSQAITILEEIKPLTGSSQYVFPSSRGNGRPMSDGTIITALKALGYDSGLMTAHGFRTTASTLLNEQGWSPDAIERQLAHAPRDQ